MWWILILMLVALTIYHIFVYGLILTHEGIAVNDKQFFTRLVGCPAIYYHTKIDRFEVHSHKGKVFRIDSTIAPNFLFRWYVEGVGPIFRWSNSHKHLMKMMKIKGTTRKGSLTKVMELFGE